MYQAALRQMLRGTRLKRWILHFLGGTAGRVTAMSLIIVPLMNACDAEYLNPVSRALHPGDSEYPVANPAPTQVVQFTATVAPTISAQFAARYFIDFRTYDEGTPFVHTRPPSGCHWNQTDAFYLPALPLQLEKSGRTYRGSFALDRFQRGACGWHFARIESPTLANPIVWYKPDKEDRVGVMADIRVVVWCTRLYRYPSDPPLTCRELWTLPKLPQGFFASIPPAERMSPDIAFIARTTRRVTVELRDVDELATQYVRDHSSQKGQ
jgi:hypothetical protein